MRLVSTRVGAALAATAMSLTFSACGDDTVATMTDLATPDLSANTNHDLSTQDAADGSTPQTPGTAQLTLADLVGTFITPGAGGGETQIPFTHILFPQQSFPQFATADQYIDSDFSSTPGAVHGCLANRYDLTATPPVAPTPDENVGVVSYTGYNTFLLGADQNTAGTALNPPVPGSINCAWGGASLPYYGCIFGAGTSDAGTSVEGQDPKGVIFPPIPKAALGGACSLPGMTAVGNNCEQHPFIPTTTQLTESVQGGGSFGGSSKMVPGLGGLPAPVTIIKVNNAAPANAQDPLAGIVLDGSADVTITWSCDGSATAGSGCPTGITGATALVGVFSIASTAPRSQFGITPQYGSAQCVEQAGSATATVTLKKAAIMALMGNQTGGSALVAVAYLNANLGATMGHNVFFTAGAGNFALLNH